MYLRFFNKMYSLVMLIYCLFFTSLQISEVKPNNSLLAIAFLLLLPPRWGGVAPG